MTVTDPALAARVEAWIDSAGHTPAEVVRTAQAVLDAGFDPSAVSVVVDAAALEDTAEMIAGAASVGVSVLPATPSELNARLQSSTAEYLFVVRWGLVAGDLLPKAVGFLDRFPGVDVTFGDSVTELGHPLFRPLFSPIRLRSNDYLGPVVVARIGAIRALGGFRDEARRAQVLDLALRAHAGGRTVALVPEVLATEDLAPGDFAGTVAAQAAIVASHLEGLGVRATVDEVEPFVRRVRYEIVGEPLVSIVIPTRGGRAEIAGSDRVLVLEAIRGIVERSTYQNIEFVVVADRETPDDVVVALEELCGNRLRLVLWDAPFNFSAKMNRGAVAARRRVPAPAQRRRGGRDRRLDRDPARARATGRRRHRGRPALLRGQHGAARRPDLHRRSRRARGLRLGGRPRRLHQVDVHRARGLRRHRRVRADRDATCTSRWAASRSRCRATTTTST